MSCSFVGSRTLSLLFGSYSMAKGVPKGQKHDAIILMKKDTVKWLIDTLALLHDNDDAVDLVDEIQDHGMSK